MNRTLAALLAAFVVLGAPPAVAQELPQPVSPAAAAPAAPRLEYESPFANYRGYREAPRAVWREVNDEVARVGGHIGVLKADDAEAAAAAAGNRAAQPANRATEPAPAPQEHRHGNR